MRSYNQVKRRVCTEKEKDLFVVKKEGRRDVQVH